MMVTPSAQHRSFVYTTSTQAAKLASLLYDSNGRPKVAHAIDQEDQSPNATVQAAAAAVQMPVATVRKWLRLHKDKPVPGVRACSAQLWGVVD